MTERMSEYARPRQLRWQATCLCYAPSRPPTERKPKRICAGKTVQYLLNVASCVPMCGLGRHAALCNNDIWHGLDPFQIYSYPQSTRLQTIPIIQLPFPPLLHHHHHHHHHHSLTHSLIVMSRSVAHPLLPFRCLVQFTVLPQCSLQLVNCRA